MKGNHQRQMGTRRLGNLQMNEYASLKQNPDLEGIRGVVKNNMV